MKWASSSISGNDDENQLSVYWITNVFFFVFHETYKILENGGFDQSLSWQVYFSNSWLFSIFNILLWAVGNFSPLCERAWMQSDRKTSAAFQICNGFRATLCLINLQKIRSITVVFDSSEEIRVWNENDSRQKLSLHLATNWCPKTVMVWVHSMKVTSRSCSRSDWRWRQKSIKLSSCWQKMVERPAMVRREDVVARDAFAQFRILPSYNSHGRRPHV